MWLLFGVIGAGLGVLLGSTWWHWMLVAAMIGAVVDLLAHIAD